MGKKYENYLAKFGMVKRETKSRRKFKGLPLAVRGFRRRASTSGSHEVVLARVHAQLIWNYRQLRQSPGNYKTRANQYKRSADYVAKALNVLVSAYN